MPIPLTKKFNGKVFRSTRYTQSKKQAQEWAKGYRQGGKEVRISQLGSSKRSFGAYRNYWIVWTR